MSDLAKRWVLLALTVLTVVAVLLDLAGSTGASLPGAALPGRARAVAAAAFGPVQRGLAGVDQRDSARLGEQNALLQAELAQAQAQLAQQQAAARLLTSPSTAARDLLAGRVVAAASTVAGGRLVTLDIGLRDGVEPNLTVVSAAGLVGRVASAGEWSSDVRLIGGTGSTVGVRVGARGAIGTVSATATGDLPPRAPGLLTLTVVQGGRVAVGDMVSTLGSVGGRPYVRGIVVGTVVVVDPPRGALEATAVVRPAVDPATLDAVAVLLPPGTQARTG